MSSTTATCQARHRASNAALAMQQQKYQGPRCTRPAAAQQLLAGPCSSMAKSCNQLQLRRWSRSSGVRCMAAAARGPHGQAGSCRCHVGAMPLVGMEAIPVAPRLHSFVALELEDKSCLVLDFLPNDPTSPVTAAALLSGGSVAATARVKRLPSLIRGPGISTRFVGEVLVRYGSQVEEVEEVAQQFNSSWEPQLSLLRRDCSHYTIALVQHLTGKQLSRADLLL